MQQHSQRSTDTLSGVLFILIYRQKIVLLMRVQVRFVCIFTGGKMMVSLRRAVANSSPPDCSDFIFQILPILLQQIKKDILSDVLFVWRYRPDLNWRITVLQTVALPLGYGTIYKNRNAERSYLFYWSG